MIFHFALCRANVTIEVTVVIINVRCRSSFIAAYVTVNVTIVVVNMGCGYSFSATYVASAVTSVIVSVIYSFSFAAAYVTVSVTSAAVFMLLYVFLLTAEAYIIMRNVIVGGSVRIGVHHLNVA